jgi:hypothetical protein
VELRRQLQPEVDRHQRQVRAQPYFEEVYGAKISKDTAC